MAASDRLNRVKKLKDATDEYVGNEKKRLENEVSVLEDILKGRTGGSGIQRNASAAAEAVAASSLADYLKGG